MGGGGLCHFYQGHPTRIDVPTAVMTYNLSELELYIGKSKIVVSF